MDYTSIRQLIYKDRKDIYDFDILDEEASKIEPFLYERLIELDYLHPKNKYSNKEILRIFNDVFYFVTLFFMDKNPLAHYADYRQIANPKNEKDMLSKNREWVELSMVYVILARFNRVEWFKEKKAHAKLFDIIKAEIDRYKNSYNYLIFTQISQDTEIPIEDSIVNTITNDSERRFFFMRVDRDFAPRNIQELIESKESLKECLSAGDELCDVINTICKDKEQKLALIDRLLEPEKEGHGALDIRVTESYRSLYELKSELTGEPMPEKLPFEILADALGPSLLPKPQPVNYQQKDDEGGNSHDNGIIAEQRENVKSLKDEIARLTNIIEEQELAIKSYKEQGKGLSAPEAAMLVTAICIELGQIPANGREQLAPLIESCWGKSKSTSAEALRRKVIQKSADNLAVTFDGIAPKIARLIRELPQKIEERKNEKLKQINPNVKK